jgi:F0F1-type ATP synthase assembly protein I
MTGKPVGTPEGQPAGKGGGEDGASVAQFAGHGMTFVVAVLGGLYLGQWLDRKLGTDPWLLIVGVFTGAGAAFWSMYSKLMAAQRREDAARAARRASEERR